MKIATFAMKVWVLSIYKFDLTLFIDIGRDENFDGHARDRDVSSERFIYFFFFLGGGGVFGKLEVVHSVVQKNARKQVVCVFTCSFHHNLLHQTSSLNANGQKRMISKNYTLK